MVKAVLVLSLVLSLVGLAGACLAQTEPLEIKLDRCALRWEVGSGLAAYYDDRRVLGGSAGPVVAYPPGWAWSYSASGPDKVTARLVTVQGRPAMSIECTDPRVTWRELVTAGPGDRFRVEYTYHQDGWSEAMNSEVCLCQPAVGWFVGSNFLAWGPGGRVSGQIPLSFGGGANPFGNCSHCEFDTLFRALTVDATRPLTLYDYSHRQNLWLGRDEPMPRGVEQTWSATFAFQPRPLTVGGVRVTDLRCPEKATEERVEMRLALAKADGGPDKVTARLVADGAQPPASAEREVALTSRPAPVALEVPLPGPGQHAIHLELLAEGKPFYQSPGLLIVVPRLLSVLPGRLPYTDEAGGEALLTVAAEAGAGLRVELRGPGGALFSGPVEAGRRTVAPLSLAALSLGRSELTATLFRGQRKLGSARCDLLKATPQANVVAVDNRGRGLLVNGLPFVPAGFYTDAGIAVQTAQTEAPLGFTVVAPYLTDNLAQRRATREDLRKTLDRCAAVGMWVQLDIRAASHPPHTEAKWQWLKEEVEAFRNHPALLSYYLADEPELGWAEPQDTIQAYRRIKELDPCHPVTMVFCRSDAAVRYAAGMDVVMTDPYPIPNGPVTSVVDYCERIRQDLGDALPVWVVPQAFGGGEAWSREPSRQEERVMTYLALIHGARGIQYFICRPPIGNPTSPDLWNECRRLALEIGQLTPALTSGEEPPKVTCSAPQVHVAVFQERGAVTVLAANVTNSPLPLELSVDRPFAGLAEVLFENRRVKVASSRWTDVMDALGTRVYRLQVAPPPPDAVALTPGDLILNPSFEEAHNVGTPDGSYLSGAGGHGSWRVDPRLAVNGRQCLRLTTAAEGQGLTVSPFPLAMQPGKHYRASVWAKGSRPGLRFSLSLDALSGPAATHVLTTDWSEYAATFTASPQAGGRTSPALSLLSAGTAWFDALQVVPQ